MQLFRVLGDRLFDGQADRILAVIGHAYEDHLPSVLSEFGKRRATKRGGIISMRGNHRDDLCRLKATASRATHDLTAYVSA